jgi:hypothetical protein
MFWYHASVANSSVSTRALPAVDDKAPEDETPGDEDETTEDKTPKGETPGVCFWLLSVELLLVFGNVVQEITDDME